MALSAIENNPLDNCAQSVMVALTAVYRGRVGLTTRHSRRKAPRRCLLAGSGFFIAYTASLVIGALCGKGKPLPVLRSGLLTRIAPFFLFSNKKAGLIHQRRFITMKCSINLPESGQRFAVSVISTPPGRTSGCPSARRKALFGAFFSRYKLL